MKHLGLLFRTAPSESSTNSHPHQSKDTNAFGVLQPESSQTEQRLLHQQPPRVIQRSVNLFSFVSTGLSTPSSGTSSCHGADTYRSSINSMAASSIGPLKATAVGSANPPPPPVNPPVPPLPPPPNQATGAAAAGHLTTSRETSSSSSSNLLDHVDWEAGVLLGGQEELDELDETTLRMEMKTSMDIHRIMRSRQKNQLQLHPNPQLQFHPQQQQQQQQLQQQQLQQQQLQLQLQQERQEQGPSSTLPPPSSWTSTSSSSSSGVNSGRPEGKGKDNATQGADSNLPSTSRSKPATPVPVEGRTFPRTAVGSMSASEYPFISWTGGDNPNPNPNASSPSAESEDAPAESEDGAAGSAIGSAPSPSPSTNTPTSGLALGERDSEMSDAAAETMADNGHRAVSGNIQEASLSTGLTSDRASSGLVASDWNWDDEALDAQLFSFLLDGPTPG